MIVIGIPKELKENETRVAATPETIKKMVQLGLKVVVESNAGASSYFNDDEYKKGGAEIIEDIEEFYSSADVILKVNPPMMHPLKDKHEVDMMNNDSYLISSMVPQIELESIKKLVDRKITSFSMNLIPRISRAQKMDSLSSQSNIAGYKAVVIAAYYIEKFFPMLMTAAGTTQPVKVLVMGAGVAGLQAIATAKRLGAKVEVSDVRPAVKEQVESLGAKFIEVPFDKDIEDKGGYAKEASKDFLKRQEEEIKKRIVNSDVIITTALIAGKKAPVLIKEGMVKLMKPGSVIVDLAAEQGGNCELTKAGEVIKEYDVIIVGQTNIPATMQISASEMYSRNVYNLLLEIIKDKKVMIDLQNDIIKGSLVTYKGIVTNDETLKLLDNKSRDQ